MQLKSPKPPSEHDSYCPPAYTPNCATNNTRFCTRYCIGLTGGIASGKSAVSARFAHLGAAIVDTDVVAHELTAPNGAAMPAIAAEFGHSYLNTDGSLNRSAMRALVFDQPDMRIKLQGILHPLIHTRTQVLGEQVAGHYVVFVVPLLVESAKWKTQVDRIAVVDCAPQLQLQRLQLRPGINGEQAKQIMATQADRHQRLVASKDVLHNDRDLPHLLAQVDALHAQYLELAQYTKAGTLRT